MVEGPERQPIVLLLCPICGSPVKPANKDDIGTQFYECEKCHEKTANPTKKTYKPMMFKSISSYQDEKGNFNSIMLAKDLMDNYFFKTDKKSLTIYVFSAERGIYEPLGEILIEQIVAEKLQLEYKQHFLTDIKGYIRAITYTDLHETLDKLALENGILNVLTGEIEQSSPCEFIITRLPVAYDKTADCPAIKKFLGEVFGESQTPVVQEFIGYCLYKGMPFHKTVLLIGEGRNGKSTFLNLLTAFLGAENTAHVTFQDLCINRFAIAELFGKLANIRADLTKTTVASVGRWKELTGNDMVMAEFKHKKPFNFQSYAKEIYSCNEAPEIKEDTLAVFSRWIILACNNVFLGKNCDPKISEKLTTPQELSGLLNYALEGLKRLLTNGMFSVNETVEELRSQYIRKSNPAKAFIEEKLECVNDLKVYVEESELYKKFILYCNSENLPTMPKRSFTIAMQQFCPEAKQTMQRILGKPNHVWQFVRFKESVTTVTTPLSNSKNQNHFLKLDKPEVTVVTKPSIGEGPGQRLSIQEMRELLHNELPKGREFTEQQFLDCAVKNGWTRQDHDAFFQKLVDDGSLLRTPEGNYVWV